MFAWTRVVGVLIYSSKGKRSLGVRKSRKWCTPGVHVKSWVAELLGLVYCWHLRPSATGQTAMCTFIETSCQHHCLLDCQNTMGSEQKLVSCRWNANFL